jgi:hypothetical protein
MRLSGLFVAAILLVSATLLAQHSSGGGGASSGGSHGGYSGGSSSSASSAGSHSFTGSGSHVASTGASSHQSSSSKSSFTKVNAAPEEKGKSFWHPFRKPVQSAELKRAAPCFRGSCAVCSRGQSRNGNGACVAASNVCSAGQYYSCGGYNDCGALAQQLSEQRRQMQSQSDFGQNLRYRRLQDQYEQCLRQFSSGRFGAYAFNDALLLDTP